MGGFLHDVFKDGSVEDGRNHPLSPVRKDSSYCILVRFCYSYIEFAVAFVVAWSTYHFAI